MVTTKRALEMLRSRGLDVSYPTVARWAQSGLFKGAEREETERGPVWRIPLESVKSFEPPTIGRPPRPQTPATAKENASKRASKKHSTQKK